MRSPAKLLRALCVYSFSFGKNKPKNSPTKTQQRRNKDATETRLRQQPLKNSHKASHKIKQTFAEQNNYDLRANESWKLFLACLAAKARKLVKELSTNALASNVASWRRAQQSEAVFVLRNLQKLNRQKRFCAAASAAKVLRVRLKLRRKRIALFGLKFERKKWLAALSRSLFYF